MTPEAQGPVGAPAEFVSRRRTKACAGYVRFPFDDARFRSTGEGGMFVKLVVVDDRDYDQTPWTICCGASVSDHLGEEFVGDDQQPMPAWQPPAPDETPEQALAGLNEHESAHLQWAQRHFPNLHDEEDSPERYRSRAYLATLVLGITGWSGYDQSTERYWQCGFDDLTAEGQALYRQLQALYAGCTLHLLTFLDT